jgi:hypothetical protein
MKMHFEKDPDNPIILYYLCLASLLTKKITQCKQSIKLFKTLYSLNQGQRFKSVVVDFYFAKNRNIEKLLSKMPRLA